MATRRWVIIGVGAAATAGLVVAAVIFGLKGVEVASWVAGVAGVVIGIAALVLAMPAGSADSPSRPNAPRQGPRSIHTSGEISGIASTGDDSINIQQR